MVIYKESCRRELFRYIVSNPLQAKIVGHPDDSPLVKFQSHGRRPGLTAIPQY